MQTIVEYLRQQVVTQLSDTGFGSMFPTWRQTIDRYAPNRTEMQILNLGDHLSEVFQSTGGGGRTQSDVSGGGAAWEALICWYLNLCLIGRRTIVIKHNRNFLPSPVSDAFTVNYNNFKSNSESDLIAITFPDKEEYRIDKEEISVRDADGYDVETVAGRRRTYNLLPVLNALCHRDFGDLEIHIIQSKTNWNDNAQIPMLWDAIYAANRFSNGISVGTNGYSIHDVHRFTYSFVTVPTNRLSAFTQTATAVLRVRNLTGGNYWGRETRQGIANSLKEMLDRNLKNGSSASIIATIRRAVPELGTTYSYFGL